MTRSNAAGQPYGDAMGMGETSTGDCRIGNGPAPAGVAPVVPAGGCGHAGPVIRVRDLHKSFRIYRRPFDRLREKFAGRALHHEHCALRDVGFDLAAGEALAVLGANGAGKSTLLKLVTGILLPDSGEIRTQGRIAGLLELGTGFDGNLTGTQNLRANAGLLGMSAAEIAERWQEIIDFSELGEYIHAPVRTYSSGMVMRLGFAIAIHARPACFIVDEALSVGDARFQQKCLLRIQSFRRAGGSLLFVSHDLNAVKVLCDRALVLDHGRISFDGDPQQACLVYQKQMMRISAQTAGGPTAAASRPSQSPQPQSPQPQSPQPAGAAAVESSVPAARYGIGAVRIAAARLQGVAGERARFASGETAVLHVRLEADVDTDTLSLGLMVRDRLGQDLFGTNTHLLGQVLDLRRGEARDWRFDIVLNLGPGQYTLTLGLHDSNNYTDDVQDWWNDSLMFEIDYAGAPDYVGVCPLPVRVAPVGTGGPLAAAEPVSGASAPVIAATAVAVTAGAVTAGAATAGVLSVAATSVTTTTAADVLTGS